MRIHWTTVGILSSNFIKYNDFIKHPTLCRVFLFQLTDFCVGVNIRLDQYKIVEKTTTNTVAKIQQVQRLTKKPNFATIMTC